MWTNNYLCKNSKDDLVYGWFVDHFFSICWRFSRYAYLTRPPPPIFFIFFECALPSHHCDPCLHRHRCAASRTRERPLPLTVLAYGREVLSVTSLDTQTSQFEAHRWNRTDFLREWATEEIASKATLTLRRVVFNLPQGPNLVGGKVRYRYRNINDESTAHLTDPQNQSFWRTTV